MKTIQRRLTTTTKTRNYRTHQINTKQNVNHNQPDCVSGQVEWAETKPSALPALIGYYMATINQYAVVKNRLISPFSN